MKLRSVFWIGACLLVAPAASVLLLWGQEEKTVREERPVRAEEQSARAEEEPARAEESQVQQAEWMIPSYYDKIGARLTATLANEKQPIRQRVRAAKLLGKIKFPPAIPMLIQYIRLVDPDVTVISDDWTIALPCAHALEQYGDAAVPKIIDAYLDEPDPIERVNRPIDLRRQQLLGAILGGKTEKVATTYLAGLGAQNDKRVSEAKLEEFRSYVHVK